MIITKKIRDCGIDDFKTGMLFALPNDRRYKYYYPGAYLVCDIKRHTQEDGLKFLILSVLTDDGRLNTFEFSSEKGLLIPDHIENKTWKYTSLKQNRKITIKTKEK